jgi:hypothetical protein
MLVVSEHADGENERRGEPQVLENHAKPTKDLENRITFVDDKKTLPIASAKYPANPQEASR